MKRLVIFDLDGTLVNTIADLAAACNYALRACGYREHKVEDYPAMVGNGIYRLMARSLRAQGVEAAEDGPEVARMTPFFKRYYDVHNTDFSTPYAGVPELLMALQERGFLLAVASNKYQAAAEAVVHRLFPNIRFVGVLGQRDDTPKKPDPQIVFDLMCTAGVTDKDEVLYVGDSGVDIATARNAGVTCAAVTWGFVRESDLLSFAPAHLAHTADDILRLMDYL